MFKKVEAILTKPYKFHYEGPRLWIILSVVFFSALYVTFYFQPHEVNVDEQKISYFLVCIVHSLLPALALLIISQVTQRIIDTSARWTLSYEIIFLLILIAFVGFSNFLVRDLLYSNPSNMSLQYLKEEVLNAYEVGVFIAFIVIIINQISTHNQIKKYNESNELTSEIPEMSNASEELEDVEIKTSNVDSKKFIYAKSHGNYTEIFLNNEDKILKKLERITLGNLCDELSNNRSVLRVHKSYIVNLNEVNSVDGNSAGLKLTLNNLPDIIIPVSRNNVGKFEKLYAAS